MMKTVQAFTLALLAAAMGMWTSVASANHFTGACAAELNAVEFEIGQAVFLGQNAATDQSNLLAKLEAAGAKVQLGKPADAVDKLDDISTKVTELVSAPKPKLADGSGITTAVVGAIACVGKLPS